MLLSVSYLLVDSINVLLLPYINKLIYKFNEARIESTTYKEIDMQYKTLDMWLAVLSIK